MNVPEEFRSQTPSSLRKLSNDMRVASDIKFKQLLLDAAAEIEGGEDAYAAIVDENGKLREKLAQTQYNLQCAYDILHKNSKS